MLIESNTQRFLSMMFKHPTSGLTIREVGRRIDVSPPTASYIAKRLEKKGLIKIEKERIQHKVFGNFENKEFKELKRLYNIFSLGDLTKFLEDVFNPNAIVVFGSFSKGEDTEESDIDIFVDADSEKEVALAKFEKKLGRKIHLHVKEIKKVPEELRCNIINGIILDGFLEC